jgi:hypothetical protein
MRHKNASLGFFPTSNTEATFDLARKNDRATCESRYPYEAAAKVIGFSGSAGWKPALRADKMSALPGVSFFLKILWYQYAFRSISCHSNGYFRIMYALAWFFIKQNNT